MNIVEVGSVAKFIRGISYKPNQKVEPFTDGSVVCFRTTNVQEELDDSDLYSVPKELVKRKEQNVQEGDILVSTANSWNLVGKCCWVPDLEYDATLGGFISLLRANPSKVFPRYLYHWFNSPRTQLLARNCGRQTTNISNMDLNRAKKMKIPLPPLGEQRRIAAVLDKADALRQKRRAALAKLDTLLQATFLHMFGDPVTNPLGWEKRPLAYLCSKIVDCPHSTPKYADSETKFACVRSSDIQNGYFDWSSTKYVGETEYIKRIQRTIPQEGDIVYCREGARFGNAARVLGDKQICLGQRMMLFRPKLKITTTEFIWRYLESESVYQQAVKLIGGTASPHINIRDIKKFKIGLPPIELQKEFSQIVKKIDKQRKTQHKNLQSLDNLFHALQQRAFNGRL